MERRKRCASCDNEWKRLVLLYRQPREVVAVRQRADALYRA